MNDFTKEELSEHELNIDNPMYKCIRCESKDINTLFKIKYGLHDWFLCNACASQFLDWSRDKIADNGCAFSKEYFKRKYGNTVLTDRKKNSIHD